MNANFNQVVDVESGLSQRVRNDLGELLAPAAGVEVLFKRFILMKKASNLSPETLSFYTEQFRSFMLFIGQTGLRQDSVAKFLDHLRATPTFKGTPHSDETIMARYRGLRAFLRWCLEDGFFDGKDVFLNVVLPKLDTPRKDPMSDEHLDALFKSLKDPRDRAMMALMLDTGVRAREFCSLDLSDVDFYQRVLKLRITKNREPRSIPFGVECLKVLRRYVQVERGESEGPLFFSGRPGYGHARLRPDAMWSIVARIMRQAGLPECGPHALRRSFARLYYLRTKSVKGLQSLLGHKNIMVTDRYIKFNLSDLQVESAASSPFDEIRRQW